MYEVSSLSGYLFLYLLTLLFIFVRERVCVCVLCEYVVYAHMYDICVQVWNYSGNLLQAWRSERKLSNIFLYHSLIYQFETKSFTVSEASLEINKPN